MSTIGELVQLDADAAFRNDVQLDAYDKPYNLALLRSYLFSDAAPQGLMSSLSVLKSIVEAYNNGRLENRMVVIANYGHGKSHLALALANYFGRSADSEEVRILLNKINQASKDPASAEIFRSFKRNHSRHMVLRLRGDVTGSLRSQFVRALEQAMQGEPTLKGQTLPFWFTEAERQLGRLKGEQLQKANAYLEQFRQTVDDLIDAVKARRMDVYQRCIDVIEAVYEIKPKLGDEVSLKEIVNWAAKELCGSGKPFSGILILFDEFSLYLQNYVSQNAANELQDLTNGVDDQRQKVVLVTFSQHDPEGYVRSLMSSSMVRESVIRELNRLPKKILLYSLMESVIDAYLKQSQRLWEELNAVSGFFSQACDITFDAYEKRYKQTVGWEYENFREIVAKGCFPLHPMTAALLCNIILDTGQGGQDPRTVLQFVMASRERLSNESVIKGKRPNWVLPVELVDFFGSQLSAERYRMYDDARRKVGNEDDRENERLILKALLLHEVAELPGNASRQVAQLATMAGLEEEKAKTALRKLSEERTIRYDEVNHRYSFWAAGLDVNDYERTLQAYLKEVALNADDIQNMAGLGLPAVQPTISWGHAEDWVADSYLVLAQDFNVSLLRSKLQKYQLSSNGIVEGQRGVVFWLLTQSEEERQVLSKTVQAMLKEALSENDGVPVLIVLPHDATPSLLENLKRFKALNKFSAEQKQTYKQMHEQDIKTVTTKMIRELEKIGYSTSGVTRLRPVGDYLTNPSYRDAFAGKAQLAASEALSLCYRKAYAQAVPEFYKHYKLGSNNLRSAVKTVGVTLLENQIGSNQAALGANPIVSDIVQKFLTEQWGLLNPSTKRIQVPTNLHIRAVWDYLDDAFAPSKGETLLGKELVRLLNPPYGYDYNTLTLIFCAWFGYNAQELQVSVDGRLHSLGKLSSIFNEEKYPKDFINKICVLSRVALSRQDLSSVNHNVQEALARIDKGKLSLSEAQQLQPVLEDCASDERFDEGLRKQAGSAAELLSRELKTAQQYNEGVAQIGKSISSATDIPALLQLQQQVRDLPNCMVVVPGGISRKELLDRLEQRLQDRVAQLRQGAEKLSDLKQYGLLKQQLEQALKELRKSGQRNLVEQVGAALQGLDETVKRLERHAEEQRLQKRIADMDPNASLKTLYAYRQELLGIAGTEPQTIAARDNKLKTIEDQIARIESEAQKIIGDVAAVAERNSLAQWHRRFSGLRSRIVDTPLDNELAKLESVYQSLDGLLAEMEEIVRTPVDTPAALDGLGQRLNELAAQHQNVLENLLSPLIERGFRKLAEIRETKQEQCRLAFQQLQADFATRRYPPRQLMSRLEVPLPFLPEDLHSAWDELKRRVQTQIEEDLVSDVVESFKRIQNPELRKECLLRLKSVYEQKEN